MQFNIILSFSYLKIIGQFRDADKFIEVSQILELDAVLLGHVFHDITEFLKSPVTLLPWLAHYKKR